MNSAGNSRGCSSFGTELQGLAKAAPFVRLQPGLHNIWAATRIIGREPHPWPGRSPAFPSNWLRYGMPGTLPSCPRRVK